MITIHVLGFGEIFQGFLNGISAFMKQDSFWNFLRLTALVGIIMASVGYLKRRDPMDFAKWVLGYTLVVNLVILPKTDVDIYDIAAQEARVVSNVPVVFAVTASLITSIGVELAQEYDSLLSMPDDLTYTKTGSLFGSKIIQASHDFHIIDFQLKHEMDSYLRNCVVGDIRLNHKYSMGDLGTSTNIWSLISAKASPLRMTKVNGENVTCLVASSGEGQFSLRAKLDAEIKKAYTFFGINLFGRQAKTNYETLFDTHLRSAADYYQHMTDSAADIFLQSMMINAIGDGIKNYQAFTDSTAGVVNNQVAKSKVQHRWSWEIAGQKAAWFLPLLHTLLTIMLFGIFPIIMVMTTLPNGVGIFKGYLQFFVSLQFWPVLFAILNAVMTWYGQGQSEKYGAFTMINIDKIDELHADLSGVAGYLMLMIPFIAKGFVSNLSEAFSGLATSMTGHLQGSAMAVANDAASASFGLGQTSFYNTSANNMNANNTSANNISENNTSANKHDTNWTNFHGMRTEQMDNGATVAETGSGHRSINVGAAMSQLALNLHTADKVSDALHRGVTDSFSHANQLRTSSDSHFQAALSKMKHFTNIDSNDYRSGEGKTLTTNDSIGHDLRLMEDSVKQYNTHHDVSDHLSREEAISANFNTEAALVGKVASIGFGISGNASTTGREGHQSSKSAHKFLNSSEGKAFSEAYNHMIATATNNHLDASDAKNLSSSEQIAANFATSHALLKQASSEYSHGVQLQKAASHVSEHGSGIETNLNQPFHDWVFHKHGKEGERVLMQTDLASINKQNEFAEQFFKSTEGQHAVSAEVNKVLQTSGQELRKAHALDSSKMKLEPVANHYNDYAARVDSEGESQGLLLMSNEKLNQSMSNLTHNRGIDINAENKKIREDVDANTEGEKISILSEKGARNFDYKEREKLLYSQESSPGKIDK